MKFAKIGALVAGAYACLSAMAATYYVDAEKGDDGYDGSTPDRARKTLGAALELLTANNDELHFAKGRYVIESEFSTSLSGLKFIGETGVARDVVLDGCGAHRFVTFAKRLATARIESLTLSNCYANATYVEKGNPNVCHGAAVNFPNREGNSGTGRVFTNVVFIANTNASACGSCVYTCGGLFEDCVFERNYALKGGTATSWQDSGVGGATFRRCAFVANGSGSGASCINSIEGTSGALHVYDCGFTNNQTLCISRAKDIISNCTFQSNASCINFGTMHALTEIRDCRFYDTVGKAVSIAQAGLSLYGCTFERGGDRALTQSSSRIENLVDCTFRDNIGGAVSADVGYMANCVFERNVGTDRGGAWYFETKKTDLGSGAFAKLTPPYVVTNCIFRGNSLNTQTTVVNPRAFGAACCIGREGDTNLVGPGVSVRFFDCEFTGNAVTNCKPTYCFGGAVFSPFEVGFTRCGFTNNSAKAIGGAFFGCASGGITNCTFVGNRTEGANSQGRGGALALMTGNTNDIIDVCGCVFEDNRCYGSGAAIFCRRGHLRLSECRFERNGALDGGTAGGVAVAFAHAVPPVGTYDHASAPGWVFDPSKFTDSSYAMRAEIDRCVFFDNTSPNGAGAINMGENPAWSDIGSPVGFIRNSLFAGNSGASGGAVRLNKQSVTVENCTFTNNAATDHGGGIYVGQALSGVTNCVFHGNSAAKGNPSVYSAVSPANVGRCFSSVADTGLADGVNGCIVKDENPFRSDDHTDLALKKDCGFAAGLKLGWMTDDSLDLGGKPRLAKDGSVDFGCYQFWRKPGLMLLLK